MLSSPKESSVPCQGSKLSLTERGHVITAGRFNKKMNEIEVETTIHEAFDGFIPPPVDIEILQSVGRSLAKLVLAPVQPGVDGMIVHRLFKRKWFCIEVPEEYFHNILHVSGMIIHSVR